MKSLVLALVATLATSMAIAAPGDRDPGRRPGRPGPVQPPQRPERPDRPDRPRPPQRDEVVRLGGVKLQPVVRDAATIRVNSCAAGEQTRVSSVRIVGVKHTAFVEGIRVVFGNGGYADIRAGFNLAPGQSTNWVDLVGSGRGRCVKSISVYGTSRSIGFKKAEVDVYGLRSFRSELDLQDRREEN